jgi:hypothetical protein
MIFRVTAYAAVGLLAGYLGYIISDRTTPVEFLEYRVLTPQVQPGGDLRIRYRIVRKSFCATHVDRFIFDAEGVRISLESLDLAAGGGELGSDAYISAVQVPRNIAQGPARYRAIVTYTCNWIQHVFGVPVKAVTQDVEFEVVGEPLPSPFPQELGHGQGRN